MEQFKAGAVQEKGRIYHKDTKQLVLRKCIFRLPGKMAEDYMLPPCDPVNKKSNKGQTVF